jgi:hypothetical protein
MSIMRIKDDVVVATNEPLAAYIKASMDAEQDMEQELREREAGWLACGSLLTKEVNDHE